MDISAIALEGLHQAEAKMEKAAARIASFGADSFDGANVDTVDLSEEMLALMSARNEFSVNLKTLETAAEVEKNMIDLMA
jgi:flagellar hook protein FlgE